MVLSFSQRSPAHHSPMFMASSAFSLSRGVLWPPASSAASQQVCKAHAPRSSPQNERWTWDKSLSLLTPQQDRVVFYTVSVHPRRIEPWFPTAVTPSRVMGWRHVLLALESELLNFQKCGKLRTMIKINYIKNKGNTYSNSLPNCFRSYLHLLYLYDGNAV